MLTVDALSSIDPDYFQIIDSNRAQIDIKREMAKQKKETSRSSAAKPYGMPLKKVEEAAYAGGYMNPIDLILEMQSMLEDENECYI